jgi:hypothetical protein
MIGPFIERGSMARPSASPWKQAYPPRISVAGHLGTAKPTQRLQQGESVGHHQRHGLGQKGHYHAYSYSIHSHLDSVPRLIPDGGWLTLFRRGNLGLTQPMLISFLYQNDQPQDFFPGHALRNRQTPAHYRSP